MKILIAMYFRRFLSLTLEAFGYANKVVKSDSVSSWTEVNSSSLQINWTNANRNTGLKGCLMNKRYYLKQIKHLKMACSCNNELFVEADNKIYPMLVYNLQWRNKKWTMKPWLT